MLYDRRTNENGIRGVDLEVRSIQGEVIPHVMAVDTTEGWFKTTVFLPGSKHPAVDRVKRELVTVRIHENFDVVHRPTGRTLHKVRWTVGGTPTCRDEA